MHYFNLTAIAYLEIHVVNGSNPEVSVVLIEFTIILPRVVLKKVVVGDANNSLFRTTLAKTIKHGCLLNIEVNKK